VARGPRMKDLQAKVVRAQTARITPARAQRAVCCFGRVLKVFLYTLYKTHRHSFLQHSILILQMVVTSFPKRANLEAVDTCRKSPNLMAEARARAQKAPATTMRSPTPRAVVSVEPNKSARTIRLAVALTSM